MLLHDEVAETSFSELIDARFPYNDARAASVVMARGWAISLNAAFAVLYELCSPPQSADVGEYKLLHFINEWDKGPAHPLKYPVLNSALHMLQNEGLPWQEAVDLMRCVGQYDGQRAALAIVSRAAYCPTPEAEAAVYNTEEAVRQAWDQRGC